MSATSIEGAVEAELVVSPAEAAQEIQDVSIRYFLAARRTVEDAMRIGELLGAVKASLKHGKFEEWIRKNCGFSERCARKSAWKKCGQKDRKRFLAWNVKQQKNVVSGNEQ
jgi:Protein of unknown function (DUF3102)